MSENMNVHNENRALYESFQANDSERIEATGSEERLCDIFHDTWVPSCVIPGQSLRGQIQDGGVASKCA